MKIEGSVLSNEGDILSGVRVEELYTNNATTTNAEGKFVINVASANSEIRFSLAGYDYDTIYARDFNSYFELYLINSLDPVNVWPKPNAAAKDNTMLWIIGGLAAAFIGYKALAKPTPKPRKVTV